MRSWCLWVGRQSSLAGQHTGVEFVFILSPTPQTGKSLGLLIKRLILCVVDKPEVQIDPPPQILDTPPSPTPGPLVGWSCSLILSQ